MLSKILVVDDSKTDLMMIKSVLYDYDLITAENGLEAIKIIENDRNIDLMLLDLNMPVMNGFEVLERVCGHPEQNNIAVLILTNYNEVENEILGLNLGALDYIRKPLNMKSLRKRIEVHINLKKSQKELERNNLILEKTVEERTKELVLTRDITIHGLVGLLETRNIESGNHTKRTQWMMKALCASLLSEGLYLDCLTKPYIDELFNTAPLHDIGKVGIPDNILLKPGKLTQDEFEIMKKHTEFGVQALQYTIDPDCGNMVSFIKTAIEIIGTHHEKYDGSGYPAGLCGDEIPLAGRLMAIIDVYDALVNKRVYKPAFSHREAMDIILSEKGRHFDPEIVTAFVRSENRIKEINKMYHQNLPERE